MALVFLFTSGLETAPADPQHPQQQQAPPQLILQLQDYFNTFINRSLLNHRLPGHLAVHQAGCRFGTYIYF